MILSKIGTANTRACLFIYQKEQFVWRAKRALHVYGIEWDESGTNYDVDGKFFTVPINIGLDNEIFPGHRIPKSKEDLEWNRPEGEKDDGIVDFTID